MSFHTLACSLLATCFCKHSFLSDFFQPISASTLLTIQVLLSFLLPLTHVCSQTYTILFSTFAQVRLLLLCPHSSCVYLCLSISRSPFTPFRLFSSINSFTVSLTSSALDDKLLHFCVTPLPKIALTFLQALTATPSPSINSIPAHNLILLLIFLVTYSLHIHINGSQLPLGTIYTGQLINQPTQIWDMGGSWSSHMENVQTPQTQQRLGQILGHWICETQLK